MAKIKVVLYKSKILTNGEHPILIRITHHYRKKYIATGYSSSIENWDEEKDLPRQSHPYCADLVQIIRLKLAEASKMNVVDTLEDKESTVDEISQKLKRGDVSKITLFEFFDTYEKELFEQKRIGYSKLFRYVSNSLKIFTKNKDLRFKEVNLKFLNAYEDFLKDKKKRTTTRSAYFRTFRTLFKEAIKRKICPSGHFPFKDFDFSDYNDPETEPRAIDKSEVKKLFEIGFPENTRRFLSQMLLKFSYYASGMNFIDMGLLRWNNIQKDTIRYIREKTGKENTVTITQPIKEVLDYYRGKTYKDNESYVFPILMKEYPNTPKAQNAKRNTLVQKRGRFNKDLKFMAKVVGIDENLTSYTIRHSFAHNSYKYGVEKKMIGQAMGHRYEKITNKYIGKLDRHTVAEEILSAID